MKSPLVEAILAMDTDAALAALPAGAHDRDGAGVSALLLARYRGMADVVAAIVEARAGDVDLWEAAAVDDVDAVARHLAAGADPDGHTPDGFPVLGLAAFFDAAGAAALLLRAGADVHVRATGAMTVQPIHSAVASPTAACLPLVLAAGADVDATQAGGFTALHEAVLRGRDDLVALLRAAGADPEIRDDEGRTPADLAAAAR